MRTLHMLILLMIFLHACCGSILILTGCADFESLSGIRNILREIPKQYHSGISIWLTAAIGGFHLFPVTMNFRRHPHRFRWAMAASCLLLLLICLEGLLIRQQNRFQMLLAVEAACTLFLAYTLEKEEEKTSSGAVIINMKHRKRKKDTQYH